MATKKTKETNRDREYMQSLKASRAAQKSSKSNSPSASTRQTTANKNVLKNQKQYKTGMLETASIPFAVFSRKPTKTIRAQNKVEKTFRLQTKAEDKDMARRRRLINAKKNVNKKAK
jgi:hypothetical protein